MTTGLVITVEKQLLYDQIVLIYKNDKQILVIPHATSTFLDKYLLRGGCSRL